jgi:TrmH family RNA methyltransferase
MLSKTIVKYIQSLAHKKLRDEEGIFIAEGPKVVEELLVSKVFPGKMICGLPQWMDDHTVLLNSVQADKHVITETELERISHLQAPNRVVAVFGKKEDKITSLANRITLMLDEIQDPGNMGTIIRTADWFGLDNIICSKDCADHYNPKVVQASMGSIARVNIIHADLEDFIRKNKSLKIFAATLDGQNVSTYSIPEGIILIGNESKGVKPQLLDHVEARIKIPGSGRAESLNAAVACGIILSHVVSI